MSQKRTKYDRQFREGAVRIVEETEKPIAQVARDLGVNEAVPIGRDGRAWFGGSGSQDGSRLLANTQPGPVYFAIEPATGVPDG